MARFTINPVHEWDESTQRYVLVSHDGQYEIPDRLVELRFDRSIQQRAKSGSSQATGTAGGFGQQASQIGSTIIPGLEQQATTPTGYTPLQKSRMLTSGAEAVGGVNSGLTGQANLTALRTRTPGGFSAALAEAARQKGRQLSTNALDVENADARLAQEKQRAAQQQLGSLYGMDTNAQLRAMGLANEDLNTALQAGKSGWLQQLEGGLGTLGSLASGAGGLIGAIKR